MNEELSRIDINGVTYYLLDENTKATLESKIGYYECNSEASSASKTIAAPNYVLGNGGSVKVKMTNANTADNATLNINSTGAKPLYYNGEQSSASNSWKSGETVEIYYDGSKYYANNVAGGSGDGAFDVSAKYPTSGVDGGNTYTLDGALAVLNTNLSAKKKKGGMSIKFIQSSDNKYVRFNYLLEDATTKSKFANVANWQGVDDEPTASSSNLVKSGGIFSQINKADNWYIASRASITFNESSVKIGNGYLYFRKGNSASININHVETTYNLNSSSHLCLNIDTRTISVKSESEIKAGDIDLLYHDREKGFSYGLLFDYYLNNKINETKSEISEIGKLTAQNIPISAVNTLDNQYITSDGTLANNKWCKVVGTLNVLKGQTVVFETKITNSAVICTTDESMTSFTPVVIQPSMANATRKRYEYYADEDCYVALSGRTSDFWFAVVKYHIPTFTDLDNKINEEISDVKTELSNKTVPSFVFEDGMDAYQRIIKWANSDNIFLLGFITDVHSGGTTKYVHNKYLSALGEPLGFDILCNGGDIGLDTPDTPDTRSRFEMMYNTKKGMIGNIPWVFLKGNHERLQSMAELGQIYNKSFNSIYGNFVFGDIYGLYGYRDYTDKKIRIIFLNTSDNDAQKHYSMSATQLQWLSNTLLNTPANYGIVVLTHRMIDSIGRWKSNMSSADGEPWDTYRSILKDFVARASGSGIDDDVTWDFSTADAKLVCNLAGDSHFNSYVKRDGVNYIVRQGMQNAGSEMQGDATAASFDWKTKICLDALAIKKDGIAKVFRVGVGGSDYDLSFTY